MWHLLAIRGSKHLAALAQTLTYFRKNGAAIIMGKVKKMVQKPMKKNMSRMLMMVPPKPHQNKVHPRPVTRFSPKNCWEPQ
jgi:hypothetical protein